MFSKISFGISCIFDIAYHIVVFASITTTLPKRCSVRASLSSNHRDIPCMIKFVDMNIVYVLTCTCGFFLYEQLV